MLFRINHRVDVYFHENGNGNQQPTLAQILDKLNLVLQNQQQIMATSQERYDAIMKSLNDITNNIAEDYQKLLEEARTKTVSDESLARGEANVERLRSIANSVENPLPPGEEPAGTPQS